MIPLLRDSEAPRASRESPPVPQADDSAVDLFLDSARYVLSRRFRIVQLVYDAYVSLSDHPDLLAGVREDLGRALRLLLAWGRRSYRRISWRPVLLIGAAVLYLVLPIRLPALGLGNEATVVTAAMQSVRDELDAFQRWERQQLAS